ncbi:hypothetical protein ACFPIJ_57335 [Dactylosporangium cerinum]|uniref:Uncharacterized protein n=1 Tax=Dactylosporangium cerinum TaxID=1434730 RepID=A0ABV9WGZ3_9ACTN
MSLPSGTATTELLHRSASRVAAAGLTCTGGVPHFLAVSGRSRQLLDRWNGMTAGGAVARLDLTGMRHRAMLAASAQWQWWRHVTASTPTARTWTELLDRVDQDPDKYPLSRALRDYHSQSRVLAMQMHNAMPGQPWPLPLADIEAFQAGQHAYINLAWLSAVPADGLACHGGLLLQPDSDRLSDRITYLRMANAHLQQLPRDAALVAVMVTGPLLPLDS